MNIQHQNEIDTNRASRIRSKEKFNKRQRDKNALAKLHQEKVQDLARQKVTLSDEDRFAAFKQAYPEYQKEVRRVQEANPGSPLLISVCLYGTHRSRSFKEEVLSSSLTGNKKSVPSIVMIEGTGSDKYWRQLSYGEMRLLCDIPGICVYEYSGTDLKRDLPDLAAHVEYSLQHIVAHRVITKNDQRIIPLQRVPGQGVSKGVAPFKVGLRIIVLNKDGSLKLKGATFQRNIPYGIHHKKKKISARQVSRVSESPQLKDLVDTDEEGDSKPARKFRRLTFGVSYDKYDDDKVVLLKSDDESGMDESDEVVLLKSDDESGEDDDDASIDIVDLDVVFSVHIILTISRDLLTALRKWPYLGQFWNIFQKKTLNICTLAAFQTVHANR